jgi:hypothetical protein
MSIGIEIAKEDTHKYLAVAEVLLAEMEQEEDDAQATWDEEKAPRLVSKWFGRSRMEVPDICHHRSFCLVGALDDATFKRLRAQKLLQALESGNTIHCDIETFNMLSWCEENEND